MVREEGLAKDHGADSVGWRGAKRVRKRKVRSHAKFPRPLRFALWLGLPLLLWLGIYAIGRALL